MPKTYEPDSLFVERLEWQMVSEFWRADRLKPAAGKVAVPRGVAAAVLAGGVLLTGVAVSKAADYIKDSWRKKIEVARAETSETKLKTAHRHGFKKVKHLFREAIRGYLKMKQGLGFYPQEKLPDGQSPLRPVTLGAGPWRCQSLHTQAYVGSRAGSGPSDRVAAPRGGSTRLRTSA